MDQDKPGAGGDAGEESFAELLDKSYVDPGRLRPGQKVLATVVKITGDWIFLDLGRKGEGVLDRKEIQGADGALPVKEGDAMTAYFVSSGRNELLFTTKVAGGAAGGGQLEDAWRNGVPVEGRVEKEVKGGYEVRVAGGARAFCPFSQMGLQRAKAEEPYVGRQLQFRITQYAERGRNIVLSNRAILEERRQAQLEELRGSLKAGDTVRGSVTSIRDFGAFVNLGLIEALLPISEIGWGRVEDIHAALSVGQEIEVVLTQLDWVRERFSVSLKKTLADPWDQAAGTFPVGSTHVGTVARLTAFGAFVTLAPGVDGLVHVSKLGGGKRIKHPGEAVRAGQTLEVRVEAVDQANRRISLALAAAAAENADAAEEEDYRRFLKGAPPAEGALGSLGEALKAKLAGKKRS